MIEDQEFQELLRHLYKPAQRALHKENIKSIDAMYALGKERLLDIHGIGPETIKRTEAFTGRKFN
ncbi:MAG TPA: helix-hairpin-helix domain-containing protein [Atopostipes sp.]|nr:helix-hairpin-helix domain-containing protein [Atopostipes sp.]